MSEQERTDEPDPFDRVVELFDQIEDDLGINEPDSLFRQETYANMMNELICEVRGHDIVPDNCGKPEHYHCSRCNEYAFDLGYVRDGKGWRKA